MKMKAIPYNDLILKAIEIGSLDIPCRDIFHCFDHWTKSKIEPMYKVCEKGHYTDLAFYLTSPSNGHKARCPHDLPGRASMREAIKMLDMYDPKGLSRDIVAREPVAFGTAARFFKNHWTEFCNAVRDELVYIHPSVDPELQSNVEYISCHFPNSSYEELNDTIHYFLPFISEGFARVYFSAIHCKDYIVYCVDHIAYMLVIQGDGQILEDFSLNIDTLVDVYKEYYENFSEDYDNIVPKENRENVLRGAGIIDFFMLLMLNTNIDIFAEPVKPKGTLPFDQNKRYINSSNLTIKLYKL